MQPEDPYQQPPAAPDLPDAALPSIEPVHEGQQHHQPAQSHKPWQPTTSPPAHKKSHDQGKSRLSGVGKKYFKYIEFDAEEELLAEIRKHPFGLLLIYVIGGFVALSILFGTIILASTGILNEIGFGNLGAVTVLIGFIISLLVGVMTFVNGYLYSHNVVFVTNEKLAQVLFITLFNRKLSQLSIGDVQDVTVQQNGFVPNLVGYGTLVVETAGEQQNYTFTFVPDPYETSKIIINAHETNLKLYGN